ncbi:MAG: glycosyltransferase family 4 protein [Methylococcales bacterium]
MKILYHHRTASKDGQAVHIEEMIAALRDLGHEVVVAAPDLERTNSFGDSAGWVNLIRRHLPKGMYELLELFYSIRAYRRLARLVRAHHPDILYERSNLYLLAGVWLKLRLRLPMLLEVNSPLALERTRNCGLAFPRLARWTEEWTWRRADAVLPVTRVLADYLTRAGVPDARIQIIPNGINLAHFAGAPDSIEAKVRLGLEGRIVLGFTGFVRDWHGMDRMIDWIARHRHDSRLHLLIVGDGPARADLEMQARAMQVAERITFTGLVPREEIPGMVAAFDIALQPAATEYASPLKLFEYLALGRAVIAPRESNLLEILVDGDNALLFDGATPGAFESTLERLVNDADLRRRLGEGARRTIRERRLTWTDNARRVVALGQALIDSHRE